MDIELYEQLTGITVPASQEAYVTAQINRTKIMLEGLLGYSLDPQSGNSNRIFPYNKHDTYLLIDPCTSVATVELIKGDEVLDTLVVDDDYRIYREYGFIHYLTRCWPQDWCICRDYCTSCAQLRVNAAWLWPEDGIPEDLLYVWTEMITYYKDCKTNIKSETLGTHSYTKFSNDKPEQLTSNQSILLKYAGPNGSIVPVLTV